MLDKAKTLQPAYVGIVPLAETVAKQGKSCSSPYQDSYHSLREGQQALLSFFLLGTV